MKTLIAVLVIAFASSAASAANPIIDAGVRVISGDKIEHGGGCA